jgi:hypothetical protein
MVSGDPGHGIQSTGSRRHISPDETDATCLLAGQHSPESYGWAQRRRRPSSRPWSMDAGCSVDKPQTTLILHPHNRLVASFLSTCLLVLACAGSAICRFLLVGVCSARVRAQQRPTRNVSQVAGAFQAARAAQLDDLPHQAAAIEFSSSLCAVEKRLGAASEATGMSGLGQVGGPSLPPMCPSGGVIAGNAQTACAAVATPTHRCTRRWERCV